MQLSVSLFDTAIASLANQATNWLIANHLPLANGSLHPNIAPYGEIFKTKDGHSVTFAIGSDTQFKNLCKVLNLDIYGSYLYQSNQQRIINREALFHILTLSVEKKLFSELYDTCVSEEIPIGKIRDLKEVFELPEAKSMLNTFTDNGHIKRSVKSISFKFTE